MLLAVKSTILFLNRNPKYWVQRKSENTLTNNQEYKQWKRSQGLCYYCQEPAMAGYTACPRHHESHYRSHRKYVESNRDKLRQRSAEEKQKRIKGGRCRDCGKPLDEELDNGHVVCLNCRIKLRRPQWVTNGINKKESSYQP